MSALFAIGACDCSKDPPGNSGDAMPDVPLGDGAPDVPLFPNCGTSTLEGGETCDDGNSDSGDGCSSACVLEAGWTCPTLGAACVGCGDGIIQAGEVCDDHNQTADDGCSPTCIREVGWDCVAEVCTPSQCGDGHRVGPEDCDDGNYRSGDGCTIRCTIEPGYVCVTENFPCRQTVCGDGSVEAEETCDDGVMPAASGDGCSNTCRLESGHYCPTPGMACTTTTCGDSLVQGLEQCDDGASATPGCSASCQLEAGYLCPTPGQPCVASTCGNGVREGLEGCDDQGVVAGDGCSATCAVEPFFQCTGAPLSVCRKPVEFVRIAKFDAPMDQPQAVHYDPRTRSFVAYDFDHTDPNAAQEFCLDGSKTEVRDGALEARRDLVGPSLDGAAYDPFRDTFLFVKQNGRLFEINRSNNVVFAGGTQLNGLGVAGGVQVGDDGRIYATNHHAPAGNGPGLIRVFTRAMNGSVNPTSVANFSPLSLGSYLDNIFNIPGLGWIGYYNFPNPARGTNQAFTFHTYDGTVVGVSDVPGVLFRNGEYFPKNADGGEAAVDGGYFLVCSEYLADSSPTNPNGICQLFAQTCESSLDCASRVPGTICKLDAPIPYCFAPAVARDDRFVVPRDSTTDLDVMLNDAFSDSVCTGSTPTITSVSVGSAGSTITIGGGGTRVHYVAVAGQCGFVETFTYTANLGSVVDTATVFVTVPCVCGNSMVEAGEECDDGGTTAGDGCSATCQNEAACGNGSIEEGEQCDDDNTFPGDGCSPTCLYELE